MAVVNVTAADGKRGGTGYAGTATGKVYKTTNSGGTWTLVHTIAGQEITALWIDAVYNHTDYPSDAIILVGTNSGRIDKSIDSGSTFAQVSAFSGTGSVKYLISDPRNYMRWYVGCGSILYVTNDNGASFDTLYDFGDAVIEDAAWSYWTEFLVGLSGTLGANTSAMHSSDDGVSFTTGVDLPSELSAISMSPFEKTEAVALEKDAARSWKVASAADDSYTWAEAGALIGKGQCLRVDGDMWATVYAGTNQRLMKSLDLGDSWYTVKEGVDVRHISLGPLQITNPTQIYFWVADGATSVRRYKLMDDNSVIGDPSVDLGYTVTAIASALWNKNICYAVTVSASTIRLHKTTDGSTWAVVATLSSMGSLTVYPRAIYVDPDDSDYLIFGTAGNKWHANTGLYRTTNGGGNLAFLHLGSQFGYFNQQPWMVSGGIWSVFKDSDDTLWTMHDSTDVDGTRANTAAFSKSTDGGSTWIDFATTGNGGWDEFTYAGAVWSSDGTKLFYYGSWPGGSHGGYLSLNGGTSFTSFSDIGSGAPWTGGAVRISSVNTSRWYSNLSSAVSYITRSTDNGDNWAVTSDLGIADKRAIICDQFDENLLFVAGVNGNYLVKSTDNGSSWTVLTGAGAIYMMSVSYGRS